MDIKKLSKKIADEFFSYMKKNALDGDIVKSVVYHEMRMRDGLEAEIEKKINKLLEKDWTIRDITYCIEYPCVGCTRYVAEIWVTLPNGSTEIIMRVLDSHSTRSFSKKEFLAFEKETKKVIRELEPAWLKKEIQELEEKLLRCREELEELRKIKEEDEEEE